jgi:hypothetical protein
MARKRAETPYKIKEENFDDKGVFASQLFWII